MNKIYLLRHAQPDFGGRKHVCIGSRSNPPLSEYGRMQAQKLAEYFEAMSDCRIYSSPLLRARQTAEIISRGRVKIEIIEQLKELDCGQWDGLTFAEIRERDPEIFAIRAEDPSFPPPDGETFDSGLERMKQALASIPEGSDAIVVAHAGINRTLLCKLLGRPAKENREILQDYACINILRREGGRIYPDVAGLQADDIPNVEEMYEICATPSAAVRHCSAVAEIAIKLGKYLDGKIDLKMLECAALLHDMCRHEQEHAKRAAQIMRDMGYLRLADIIACHHDCPSEGEINEGKLLFLADKLCFGSEVSSIDERFERSLKKCTSDEARQQHARRWEEAKAIENQFLREAGIAGIKEVIL